MSDFIPHEANQNCNFPSFRIPQTERIDIDVSNFPIGPLEEKLGQDLLASEKSTKTPSDDDSSKLLKIIKVVSSKSISIVTTFYLALLHLSYGTGGKRKQ
jgi:hypothetical protein